MDSTLATLSDDVAVTNEALVGAAVILLTKVPKLLL